jgi:flagellar hook-associated protein 3 FlgL
MISGISTASMSSVLSKAITDQQQRLSVAQKELATGQRADLSLAIGAEMSRDSAIHMTLGEIDAVTATDDIVSSRLGITSTSLQKLQSDAQSLRSALVSVQDSPGNRTGLSTQAQTSLGDMISTLNVSDGDTHVFGGVTGNQAPVANYFAASSAAKTAFDQAFVSNFGFPPSDPQVSTITGAQMQSFLSGPVANLFSSSSWSQNWSSASSQPLQNRISLTSTVNTSVTANDPAFQNLAAGYAMMTELSSNLLSSDAYQAVTKTAMSYVDTGVSGLISLQQNVGVMQSQVQNAKQSMATQKDLLSNQLGSLENVDLTQASVTVNSLLTQIETSYALTAQIQRLSLAKYL